MHPKGFQFSKFFNDLYNVTPVGVDTVELRECRICGTYFQPWCPINLERSSHICK